MNACVRMVLLASMLAPFATGGASNANANDTPYASVDGEVAWRGYRKGYANAIGRAVWPTPNISTSQPLWGGAGVSNRDVGASGEQRGQGNSSRQTSSEGSESTRRASSQPSRSTAGNSDELHRACSADSKTRWLYVRGFHHSGTTLLTDILALHPSVGSIKNGGRFEDEGQHLQKVFPTVGARSPGKCKGNGQRRCCHNSLPPNRNSLPPTNPGDIYTCPAELKKFNERSSALRATLWQDLCKAWVPHVVHPEREFYLEKTPDLMFG